MSHDYLLVQPEQERDKYVLDQEEYNDEYDHPLRFHKLEI